MLPKVGVRVEPPSARAGASGASSLGALGCPSAARRRAVGGARGAHLLVPRRTRRGAGAERASADHLARYGVVALRRAVSRAGCATELTGHVAARWTRPAAHRRGRVELVLAAAGRRAAILGTVVLVVAVDSGVQGPGRLVAGVDGASVAIVDGDREVRACAGRARIFGASVRVVAIFHTFAEPGAAARARPAARGTPGPTRSSARRGTISTLPGRTRLRPLAVSRGAAPAPSDGITAPVALFRTGQGQARRDGREAQDLHDPNDPTHDASVAEHSLVGQVPR